MTSIANGAVCAGDDRRLSCKAVKGRFGERGKERKEGETNTQAKNSLELLSGLPDTTKPSTHAISDTAELGQEREGKEPGPSKADRTPSGHLLDAASCQFQEDTTSEELPASGALPKLPVTGFSMLGNL